MKAILNDKAMRKLVEEFIANPDAEFPLNADGKPHGFTQKQQALVTLILLTQIVFTEYDEKQFNDALMIIYGMANGSADRQCLEVANLLAKTEGGKRGADVRALASKWSKNLGS